MTTGYWTTFRQHIIVRLFPFLPLKIFRNGSFTKTYFWGKCISFGHSIKWPQVALPCCVLLVIWPSQFSARPFPLKTSSLSAHKFGGWHSYFLTFPAPSGTWLRGWQLPFWQWPRGGGTPSISRFKLWRRRRDGGHLPLLQGHFIIFFPSISISWWDPPYVNEQTATAPGCCPPSPPLSACFICSRHPEQCHFLTNRRRLSFSRGSAPHLFKTITALPLSLSRSALPGLIVMIPPFFFAFSLSFLYNFRGNF